MIVVAAMLKVAEGKGDEVEQKFRELVPKVLKDPGTIAYVIHRSIDDPSKFFVYEKYEDREALKKHSSTPHFQEFFQAMSSMLAGRPEIELYNEIA
ncbi:(4S)-4-hydroxy-5-phosphonooxypentane-2,3-dione isomerase [subsurface metagenome]